MYSQYGGPTVLGIEEKWERVLCYALGWVSGLVLLIIEQRNHNVRRHAMQSIVVFGPLSVLLAIVSTIGGLLGHIWVIGILFSLVFGVLGGLIWVLMLALWLGLMFMAYSRPDFVLPLGIRFKRLVG